MDAEVRRLERRLAEGEDVSGELARARAISGLDAVERAAERAADPSWKATQRREAVERKAMAAEVAFCRRAVNDGIVESLYRGPRCWCSVFMSLRRLEGLRDFEAKPTSDLRFGMLEAGRRSEGEDE